MAVAPKARAFVLAELGVDAAWLINLDVFGCWAS